MSAGGGLRDRAALTFEPPGGATARDGAAATHGLSRLDRRLGRLVATMQTHPETPLSIVEICRRAPDSGLCSGLCAAPPPGPLDAPEATL